MIMIAPNSRGHERGSREEFRRRGMVQPSQQHVAPYEKKLDMILKTILFLF